MMAAVQLHQHPLPRHPLTTDPVGGWTAAARTGKAGSDQDPSQGDTTDLDAFTFTEQLAQMGVVGAPVPGAGEVDDLGDHAVRGCIGRPSSPVAVSECGRAILSVGRQ